MNRLPNILLFSNSFLGGGIVHFQMLPEDRLAALMKDLFSVGLVPATIARMSQGCAMRFQGVVDWICGVVKVAAVKHQGSRI